MRDVGRDSNSDADLGITYKIDDVPPWYMCLFLGFQHFLTMIGGTLSIPFILCPALCMRYPIHYTVIQYTYTLHFNFFFSRDDDPARGYIISSIFFVSGIVTFLQSVIGCRLPIIQGGTFTFVTPTLAILALDKWSNQCPALDDDQAWGQIDEEARRELWQVG